MARRAGHRHFWSLSFGVDRKDLCTEEVSLSQELIQVDFALIEESCNIECKLLFFKMDFDGI
ncbi:hypothetical protein V1VFAS_004 [Rhizobium phage V1VFA-S]|nr:hypothetical protein V1VFAS_004 [Rhizobium phage V1VFA-S]